MSLVESISETKKDISHGHLGHNQGHVLPFSRIHSFRNWFCMFETFIQSCQFRSLLAILSTPVSAWQSTKGFEAITVEPIHFIVLHACVSK